MLRFGSAKARFTANATYRQTSAVQAAQAVKADALKARQHLVVVVTKEAASAAVNAEAATGNQAVAAVIAEAVAVTTGTKAETIAARVVVITAQVVKVEVAQVVATVPVAQERDNK